MKKFLGAAALSAALWLGGTAFAADLTLPGGVVLPFAKDITVHAGSDSYFAKRINDELENPKLSEAIAVDLVKSGLYTEKEKDDAKFVAEGIMKYVRESRVYQLRAEADDVMYTAYAVSVPMSLPMSEEDTARWAAAVQKLKTLANKETLSEQLRMHGELAESIEAFLAASGLADKKTGVSKGGVAYETADAFTSIEQDGGVVPFYCYYLGTTKDDTLTMTVVFADQISGKYFEPFLKKATEAAK